MTDAVMHPETPRNAEQLRVYVASPAFEARKRRVLKKLKRNEGKFTWEEVARDLDIPLELVLLDFSGYVARKTAGQVIPIPVARTEGTILR